MQCKYTHKYTLMQKMNPDSLAFASYLQNLSTLEKTNVIDNLCEACMVPRYTIQNWRRGLARIPAPHKCKIEETIGEKIFSDIKV